MCHSFLSERVCLPLSSSVAGPEGLRSKCDSWVFGSARPILLMMVCACFVLVRSANAEVKVGTIKNKATSGANCTSAKIAKNNGNMTIAAPAGAVVKGPAAGSTGTWEVTGLNIPPGGQANFTFTNPDGTANYRFISFDYQNAAGKTVWTGKCNDPIAYHVLSGGPAGDNYLGYPIPAGQYGYFYQMFPNATNNTTVLQARINLGVGSGAYNFQVLNNSFRHFPDPGFDLDDIQVPLRDPPNGYNYDVLVPYMGPEAATGIPGIPTAWSYNSGTNVATMDFTGAGGLAMGMTGSIVAFTSPYPPTVLPGNVAVDYQGGVEPPCTGTFAPDALVPTPPPLPDPLETILPTRVLFGSSDVPVIPSGFFGPGSLPFSGLVQLKGGRHNSDNAAISVLIQRSSPMNCPGSGFPRPCDNIPIEIVSLDLVSTNPITVNGPQVTTWNVEVALSQIPSPLGSMGATIQQPNGGTYGCTLPVSPKFTFTNVNNPGDIRVLDYGISGNLPIQIQFSNVPWVVTLGSEIQSQIVAPSNGNFVPGVFEQAPGNPSSQVVVTATGNSSGGGVIHRVEPPPPPPPPDPHSTTSPTFAFFGSSDIPALPSDFFYPGSQPFFGSVQLTGNTADSRDTLVQRSRALDPSQPTETVPIEIVALDLRSINPISVFGSQGPTQWNVQVQLSATPESAGSLSKTSNGPNGGTFDATFPVQPLFIFTQVENPTQVAVLDTGLQGMPPVIINLNSVPYVVNLAPHLQSVISAPNDGNFVPGVSEQNPGDPLSQVIVIAQGNSSGGGVTHAVEPPPPPPPPPDPHRTANPTNVNFGAPDVPPIPADFFYPGSQPFFGFVQLEGAAQDSQDTLIQRTRALDHSLINDSVPIEIVSLNLTSVAPISVNGIQGTSLWSVQVQLSTTAQNPGVLNKTTTGPNGGTFDATIPVRPRFIFTRVDDPSQVRVLDAGLLGNPPIQIEFHGVPYVVDLAPHLDGVIYAPSDGNFVPGVMEQVPGQPPTQIVVQAVGQSQGGGVTHTVGPPVGPRLIPAGEDCWATTCGRTQYDFHATPMPLGFFNVEPDDNTLGFSDIVKLEGATGGDTDTSVRRCGDVLFDTSLPTTTSVPIELVSLNLRSCAPIAVQDCCKPAELWNVEVTLSQVLPPPCAGMMTLTKTHANGGTFTSQFPVQAKFTFTRINPPAVTYVFDTGLAGFPPENLPSEEPFAWVQHLYNESTAHACGINFVPGVEEFVGRNPTEQYPQCCTPPRCHQFLGSSLHCTAPADCSGCPGACCNPSDGSCSDVTEAQCTGIFKGIHSKCADSDNDGIADDFETGTCCGPRDACNTGTDPANPDTDGDGVLDGAEMAMGSDPCNPCSPSAANPACPSGGTDCNGNGRLDMCDVAGGFSADCDGNLIPDECQPDCDFDACADACEIICGTQTDSNNNGIPDDCEGGAPPSPVADPSGINKVRFISFSVPGGPGGTALRVKLTSLHHVSPPYTGDPTVAYTAFEGQSVYVGPPQTWVESSASGTPFKSAVTRCTPFYHDWTTEGLLHVRGSAIVPSSLYHVENLAASCNGVEGSAACVSGGPSVSGQLAIATTRWGDVMNPFNPPSTTVQPNFTDVAGLIDKFKDVLGAPIKARTLISPNDAFGNINDATMSVNVGFTHIAACVDAFKGKAYPAKMGKCSGAGTAACTTAADCNSGGNIGPCNLYCP